MVRSPTFPSAGANSECGTRCPANPLDVGDAELGTALFAARSVVVFMIGWFGLTMLLFDKTRAAGPAMRRRVAR